MPLGHDRVHLAWREPPSRLQDNGGVRRNRAVGPDAANLRLLHSRRGYSIPSPARAPKRAALLSLRAPPPAGLCALHAVWQVPIGRQGSLRSRAPLRPAAVERLDVLGMLREKRKMTEFSIMSCPGANTQLLFERQGFFVGHHFCVSGPTANLREGLSDDNQKLCGGYCWIERHIRYACMRMRTRPWVVRARGGQWEHRKVFGRTATRLRILIDTQAY